MFFVESKVLETLKLGQFLEILSKVGDPVVSCNKNSAILKPHWFRQVRGDEKINVHKKWCCLCLCRLVHFS